MPARPRAAPVNPVLAFVRSRDLPRAAAVSLVLALAAAVFAGTRVEIPDFRYLVDYGIPVAAVAPVAHAIVLGTTLHSPMADLEHTAAQPMALFRRLHLLALTALAAALSALPVLFGLPVDVAAASVRNAVGYVGLAAISARLFGSGLAWLLPLGTFGPTLLLGVAPDNTPEWWAWSIHPPYASGALAAAALLWLASLLLPPAPPRAEDRAEA
ncbi:MULTISPECIES: hypothetical protein [Streptomyces]|uniref:ABC transporter permease n=1 Tax=Streptomyces lichenis TaxID=2306967 RepID=A0ABT0I764_9ACTN|nr:hypothetical protein [Streptomyces lichenis]MCK8677132.1 hypothetical protein [Streptomyces lichenis]